MDAQDPLRDARMAFADADPIAEARSLFAETAPPRGPADPRAMPRVPSARELATAAPTMPPDVSTGLTRPVPGASAFRLANPQDRSALDIAQTPLVPQVAEGGRRAAEWWTTPRLNDSTTTATIKGAFAGTGQALSDLLSAQTSPVQLGLWALSLGSSKLAAGLKESIDTAWKLRRAAFLAKRTGEDIAPILAQAEETAARIRMLESLRRGVHAAQGTAGAGFAAQGLDTLTDTDRGLAERIGSVAQIAGGIALAATGATGAGSVHPAVERLADESRFAAAKPVRGVPGKSATVTPIRPSELPPPAEPTAAVAEPTPAPPEPPGAVEPAAAIGESRYPLLKHAYDAGLITTAADAESLIALPHDELVARIVAAAIPRGTGAVLSFPNRERMDPVQVQPEPQTAPAEFTQADTPAAPDPTVAETPPAVVSSSATIPSDVTPSRGAGDKSTPQTPPEPESGTSRGEISIRLARDVRDVEPDGVLRLYHSSPETITRISDEGAFGGLFGSPTRSGAVGLGSNAHLHVIDVPESAILTQRALDYDIDPASIRRILRSETGAKQGKELDAIWAAVIDEKMPQDIVDEGGIAHGRMVALLGMLDDGEAGWNAQRIRGVVARRLGFKAVEMSDETGTSYLVLGTPSRPNPSGSPSVGEPSVPVDIPPAGTDTGPEGPPHVTTEPVTPPEPAGDFAADRGSLREGDAGGRRVPARRPRSRLRQQPGDVDGDRRRSDAFAAARSHGYAGAEADFRLTFDPILLGARAMADDLVALHRDHGDDALLRHLAAAGGISILADPAYSGEFRDLWEGTDRTAASTRKNIARARSATTWYVTTPGRLTGAIRGIPGVLRKDGRGLSVDDAVTQLRADGLPIEDIRHLLEELHRIQLQDGPDLGKMRRDLVDGYITSMTADPQWWAEPVPERGEAYEDDEGDTTFDPTDFEMAPSQPVIDQTEAGDQYRLPGEAGAVREQEVATPEFDVPFSLTSEANTATAVQPSLLLPSLDEARALFAEPTTPLSTPRRPPRPTETK